MKIEEIPPILAKKIGDLPDEVRNDVRTAEAACIFAVQKFRELEEELTVLKSQIVMDKEGLLPEGYAKMNADEKKVVIAGVTAKEQRAVNTWKDISELLQKRVSLCQSILKSFQVEQQAGLMHQQST